MKTLFTTRSTVTGGRDGRAVSDDGQFDLPLAFPVALGGSGKGTNPEALFGAGFAACFNSSLRNVAKGLQLDAGDVTVAATVSLTLSDNGAYGITVALDATLPGLTGPDRDRVLAEAERVCAYSNATRGNVELTVRAI